MDFQKFQAALRDKVGTAKYQSWLSELAFSDLVDGQLTLTVPTSFIHNWIDQNYRSLIRETAKAIDPSVTCVLIFAGKPPAYRVNTNQIPKHTTPPPTKPVVEALPMTTVVHTETALDPKKTFDNFRVELDSNAFAFSACKHVAAGHTQYSPLYITGEVGIGKTHLLHSIGNDMISRGKRVAHYSASHFLFTFVQSVKQQTTAEFSAAIREADILLLDDIQYLTGKTVTLDAFGELLTSFVAAEKPIVVASAVAPLDLVGFPIHIRECLIGGLTARLESAPRALRRDIFVQKLAHLGAEFDDALVNYVVDRIAHIRSLEGAALRIQAHQTLMHKKVDVEAVKVILADMFRVATREPTASQIKTCVASHFGIKVDDLVGRSREQKYVVPRHIAIYLTKHLTTMSYPKIGQLFGKRDHTTVLHAIEKITKGYAQDSDLATTVDTLAQDIIASL